MSADFREESESPTSEYLGILEKDLFKARCENMKLQERLKELEIINFQNAKTEHNTSSSIALPSELRNKWEELISGSLIDSYSDFIDDPVLMVILIQGIFGIAQIYFHTHLSHIICQIGNLLGMHPETDAEYTTQDLQLSPNNMSGVRENEYVYIKKRVQNILEDNSLNIFPIKMFKSHVLEEYQRLLRILLSSKEFESVYPILFQEGSVSPEFEKLQSELHYLVGQMSVREPPIRIPTDIRLYNEDVGSVEMNNIRENLCIYEYKKEKHWCMDGFPREGGRCMRILPAPMRGDYVFMGIKDTVILLEESYKSPMSPNPLSSTNLIPSPTYLTNNNNRILFHPPRKGEDNSELQPYPHKGAIVTELSSYQTSTSHGRRTSGLGSGGLGGFGGSPLSAHHRSSTQSVVKSFRFLDSVHRPSISQVISPIQFSQSILQLKESETQRRLEFEEIRVFENVSGGEDGGGLLDSQKSTDIHERGESNLIRGIQAVLPQYLDKKLRTGGNAPLIQKPTKTQDLEEEIESEEYNKIERKRKVSLLSNEASTPRGILDEGSSPGGLNMEDLGDEESKEGMRGNILPSQMNNIPNITKDNKKKCSNVQGDGGYLRADVNVENKQSINIQHKRGTIKDYVSSMNNSGTLGSFLGREFNTTKGAENPSSHTFYDSGGVSPISHIYYTSPKCKTSRSPSLKYGEEIKKIQGSLRERIAYYKKVINLKFRNRGIEINKNNRETQYDINKRNKGKVWSNYSKEKRKKRIETVANKGINKSRENTKGIINQLNTKVYGNYRSIKADYLKKIQNLNIQIDKYSPST